MARKAMTVLYWMRPVQRQAGVRWANTGESVQTKFHVSVDGAVTACRYDVPPDAIVVAVTPDWHERATCYNCVYRLWRYHAPPGYVCPRDGQDFPLRRECPHSPGLGRDPQSCTRCTPRQYQPAVTSRAPAAPGGNPDPAVIRKWHIPSPYPAEMCVICGNDIQAGTLINIEYEAGVMHASCSSYQDR